MIGTTLGHFKVIAKLSESRSGEVYRAEDEVLRRRVVLKILSPALASDPDHIARFLNAARAAALVTHPHVAAVHEVGETEGRVWVAMELVEGPTLRSRLTGRPLPLSDTLRIGEEVAEGLAAAHERNLAHGDLRAEKVVLGPGGQVKVVDLGLGDEECSPGDEKFGPGGESPIEPYDTRTDVYRLGAMLYEMATGRAPEANRRPPAPGADEAGGAAAPTASVTIPPSTLNLETTAELDRIIGACLEPDPEDRYRNAVQLAIDLGKLRPRSETAPEEVPSGETAAERRRRSARRRLWGAAALVPAAILGLAGWLWVWPILKPGPLFKKGDRVIIADFVNQTGNPHYDTAIQEIFAAFWGSDVLTILEQDPKRTEALTAAVLEARCAKGECEGYMTGRIAREGTGYVLEVGLHRAGLHKQAMSRQEHVPDDQNLVTGIESLVSLFDGDVRRAVGAAAPAPVGEDCPEPYPSVQGCLAWLKAERYGFQNPAEMVPMLQRALDLDPGFLYARGRLGLAYANMGNMMEARRHLGEATHGYAALEEKHPGCRERQLYYEILYLGQRYDIAAQLERLNRYLQLFPDAGDMHNVLSGTLNREYMDYAAAEPHARKCYELSPLPGHFSNLVGNLAAQGKASAIEALIAEYRARDVWGGPKMKEEAIARAEIRLAEARGEDWNRIIDLIDRVNAEGRLARETVRQDRGVYLLMAGRLSEAEETLQESVRGEELDRMKTGQSVWKPNVDLLWLEWRRTGRVPVLSPEHIAFLNGNLDSIDANDFGVYSVAMGQAHPLEEVLRHHEEVEKDNLNETVREKLQFGRGCLAMIEGRATEAVALLDPLARDSDYTPRHHVLARAYEAVGRWSDAARSYEIVLKGRPIGNIQPYAVRVLDEPRLAGIYERLGNTERARYWYGRFLSDWRNADPGTPEVEDAKKRLAELGGPLPAGA